MTGFGSNTASVVQAVPLGAKVEFSAAALRLLRLVVPPVRTQRDVRR